MLIRPATPAEMADPPEFTVSDPVGALDADRLRDEAAGGRMRPEWTWFAADGSRIVGRAVWWGRADSERPLALDCLHVVPEVPDRAALAAQILSRGQAEFGATPQYDLVLRTGWRDDPDIVAAVAWRADAARAAGLTDVNERLQYAWTPVAGVPAPSDRLVFHPAGDEEFLAVFRQVAVGSLDVTTQREVAATGADRQARDDLEFYRSCPGDRSWWRLAETADGGLAGFAIPSATPYHRNVGYLGVVPELRGRGYVDDLLGQITRQHAADGADRITATTDATNAPMAAAFNRAGYQVTEIRMVFEAPAAEPGPRLAGRVFQAAGDAQRLAAVDHDGLAGDVGRVVGGQERDAGRDVGRVGEPAERDRLQVGRGQLGILDDQRRERRVGDAGGHAVDPDVMLGQVDGRRPDQGPDRRLGHVVDGVRLLDEPRVD